jgi:hypothetical protein
LNFQPEFSNICSSEDSDKLFETLESALAYHALLMVLWVFPCRMYMQGFGQRHMWMLLDGLTKGSYYPSHHVRPVWSWMMSLTFCLFLPASAPSPPFQTSRYHSLHSGVHLTYKMAFVTSFHVQSFGLFFSLKVYSWCCSKLLKFFLRFCFHLFGLLYFCIM